MHMRRLLRKTVCILSNCRRVCGFGRSSSSSSFSNPSTVNFLWLFVGRSPSSGKADTMCLGAKYPISPLEQYLNCFFKKASLPWNSRRGFGDPVWLTQSFSIATLSHNASKLDRKLPTGPGVAVPVAIPAWNMCFACITAWYILIAVKFDPCWSNPFSPSLNFKSVGLCVRAKSAVVHRQARSSIVV